MCGLDTNYHWSLVNSLILAYPKSVKDSLSQNEKAELKSLVKLLKGEDK
jgi:hypothetical protein